MSQPAYVEPDDQGHVHLKLPGAQAETFFVDGPDEQGRYRLIPVEPYESIPERIREMIEDGRGHPERWIRDRSRAR